MRRRLIHLGIVLALLIASLFVFALLGRSYLAEITRVQLAEEIGRRTGLTVRIGGLGGDPFSRLRAERVEAFTEGGDHFRAERIDLSYRIVDLFQAPPRIRSVRVMRPELLLREGAGEGRGDRRTREAGSIRPPFLVEHLAIEGGALLAGPAPAREIGMEGAIRGADGAILFELARLEADWEIPGGGGDVRVTLAGSFLVGADDCSCDVEGSFGATRFRERGFFRLDPSLRGRGEIFFDPLSLEEILPLLGRSRVVERGEARAEIRFAGTPDSLDLTVRSDGALNTLEWRDLAASGSIHGHYVDLGSITARLNGAFLEGSGRVDLSGGGESRLSAAFREIDTSRFGEGVAGGRTSNLNGTIRWTGEGRDLTNLEGRFAMRLGRSRYGDVTIRDARIEGRAEGDAVRIEESAIRTAASDLRFSGRVGFDGSFLGDLEASLPSLAEFRRTAGVDSLDGSARLVLHVDGGPERMRAEGEATVERGRVERFRADRLFLEGWFEKRGDRLTGLSRMRVGEATFDGGGIDSARVDIGLEDRGIRIDTLAAWRGDWTFRSAGSVDWVGRRNHVRLERTRLFEGDLLAVDPGRIDLWWDPEGYGVEPVSFPYGGGAISFEGESPDGDSMRAHLRVGGADLARAAEWVGLPPDILARVDLEASVLGRRGNRVGDLRWILSRAEDSDFPFRRVEGALFVLGSTIHVDSLLLTGRDEEARIRTEGFLPFEPEEAPNEEIRAVISVRDYPLEDLRFLTDRLEAVDGELSADIAVGGSWSEPVLTAAAVGSSMVFRGYSIGTIRADSICAGADSLAFVVRLDPFWGRGNRISGRLPLRISFADRSLTPLDHGPFRLDLRVPDGDLALLALLAGPVEESMGNFTLEAKLSGDRADPVMDGVFEVRDGLVFLSGSSVFFDRVDARFLLDEKRVNVVRFRSRSGERGRLNAWGTVNLQDFRPATYDIGFRAQQYDMLLADGVQLTFDGDLALRPDTTLFRKVVPHISGEADVRGALIERELAVGDGDGSGSVFDPTTEPSWTCDIFLRAPQNFWIRNRTADLELGGEAQLRRSSEGFGALGTFDVLRGRYWLYNNEFRVTEGQVTFTDPADIRRADVDLTAETDVMDERIEIRLVRDEGEMQVLPTSESGYSEGEILSMLTLRAHPQDEVNSGEILSSWFTSFANRLSREMSRGLGDIGVIEIGTSEELPEIRYGNYLSSDLYVGFSQKLRTDDEREQERSPTRENLPIPERQVRVEYRLRRSLVIQGEVGTLSDGNRFLNLDLRVRLPY
ncbi:MAG: translocation/assembly module TamB domain-containing protein [Candidatus Eisenbacteria bacterium]|nr:translocation/assembly module TamB domain-containing protein [Candidatus Eisenbacteria bacterium]